VVTLARLPVAAPDVVIVDTDAELYRRMRHASGDEFEELFGQFLRRSREDPEAVARAIAEGALPIG
jgi:hypothetical protein